MTTNLKQAFDTAVALFNAAQYDDLRPLMDTDIILKLVDDSGSVVGIGNVITYLNGHQATEQPQLVNINIQTIYGNNGTNGQISGTAQYQDQKAVNTFIDVRFTFTFSRNAITDDWLLVNAFAAPSQ